MDDLRIWHDASRQRFVAPVDGHDAFLEYRPVGGTTLDYVSTYVPERARGQGIGQRLVLHALDYARAQGCHVIPSCWFVARVIERHPEYRQIAASR